MSVSVSCVVPCGIFGRTRRALRRRLCRPGRRRFGRTVRCAGSGFDCRFGVGFCGFGGLRSVRFTGAGTACAGRTADWFINRTVDLIEICCRGFRCCRIAAAFAFAGADGVSETPAVVRSLRLSSAASPAVAKPDRKTCFPQEAPSILSVFYIP